MAGRWWRSSHLCAAGDGCRPRGNRLVACFRSSPEFFIPNSLELIFSESVDNH